MQNKECLLLFFTSNFIAINVARFCCRGGYKIFFSCLYTLPIFNTSVFSLYSLSKILVLYPCHACFHNLVKMKHFFLKYFSRYPRVFFVRKTKLWLYEYFLVRILSVMIILHLLTKVVLRFQKRFNPSKM